MPFINSNTDNTYRYNSVEIGGQLWMSEDLKVTTYRNGDPICEAVDDDAWLYLGDCQIGAYYFYEINHTKRFLYNAYAVNDPRGLAPDGWQIPDINDWETLIEYLGETEVAGGKLKDTGLENWISPNIGATNSSGFKAVGAGWKEILGGGNYTKGIVTGYWTQTHLKENEDPVNHVFLLRHDSSAVICQNSYADCGESVRCIIK